MARTRGRNDNQVNNVVANGANAEVENNDRKSSSSTSSLGFRFSSGSGYPEHCRDWDNVV